MAILKSFAKMFSAPKKSPHLFEVGPHLAPQPGDLRQNRPYFVVPVEHTRKWEGLRQSISQWLDQSQVGNGGPEGVTDVYILSHGWHRDFFAAVEVYDKVVSRFGLLLQRQRLAPSPPYHPLFLTLHWHSDPGEDGWEDPAGLRDKDEFLQNVERLFERPSTLSEQRRLTQDRFLTIFENIFELFHSMSSPDVDALSHADTETKAQKLAASLDRCTLRDAPCATLDEKISAAWTCYYNSAAKRVLLDQNEPPRRFNTPLKALSILLKFAIPTIGVSTLAGFLVPRLGNITEQIAAKFTKHGIPVKQWWGVVASMWEDAAAHPLPSLLLLELFCFFVLALMVMWHQREKTGNPLAGSKHENRSHHVPLPAILAWLPLQILFVAPAVIWALVTFFVGGFYAWCASQIVHRVPFLYDEKPRAFKMTPCYFLSIPARWPIKWLRLAVGKDTAIYKMVSVLDNQLAFWEMQFKGVEAGEDAGRFIEELLAAEPRLHGARLHFLGHSFGGLVVCNAVRHLVAHQKQHPATVPAQLHTLCLLQGAIASNWFENEPDILTQMTGSVTCIHSAYDSANSFYYPMANSARVAAGFVGLFRIGKAIPYAVGKPGLFASLVEPPNLQVKLHHLETAKRQRGHGEAWPVNLDASRVIFEGPISSGGGHDDIFKDEVIHLLWAVTTLQK